MHHALFNHVPPFSVVSESIQFDYILKVMDTLNSSRNRLGSDCSAEEHFSAAYTI